MLKFSHGATDWVPGGHQEVLTTFVAPYPNSVLTIPDSFQPFYILAPTPKNLQSLRNGLECLDEYIARAEAKQADAKSAKETLQEVQARQRALVG